MDKLFLIDGHALVFKMYYAFLRKPMINSKGADMSILFGFTKYLLEMVEREKPTYLAVAFDPPGGTFRNELYPAYKGTRPPTPQLIIDALEPLTELVRAMNIPVLMVKGFEADDVIGSMALRSAREGVDVYMVTPDKDYGQLIAEHIFQYKPGKAGGDDEIIDRTAICEKWGIMDPVQIIDMLAICGDTADNVPGVKGVGEVGAGKLVSKYGSIENIYAHLAELTPRLQAQFEEARGHIGLSKELVTIKTDIPLETTLEDMRMDTDFSPEIADLFEKYEFNSLKRFITHVGPSAASKEREEFIVNDITPSEMAKAVRKAGCCGLITEAYKEGIFSPVKRLIIGCEGQACAVPGDRLDSVRDILEDASIDKYGYDLKLQANLLCHAGIDLAGRWLDIALMHYLVDPEKSHAVDILSRSYLNIELDEAPANPGTGSLFDEAPEAGENVRSREAAALVLLGRKVREELADRQKLYDEMEEPLAKVLAKMERAGVKVDLKQLDRFAKGLREEMVAREAHIREMVGEPDLNISSPKQVGDVLFDKLRLDPKAKKSARGQYSTDEATLLAIADRHPVVNEILEFRAVKKLLSTYIEPFPTYVSPVDGRVHTTFNQALTATGRLSSSNPNLQNIPIRTERGKEIRKAFIPGTPEGVIVSADYSQIELRIMAHLSLDEHLVKAFRDGDDVHAATAAKIYGIPLSEVTREQRGHAKTANFGIMYGISSFGLAQRLNMGRKEAKELIDGYFASFPAIRSFIDDSIGFARENGYVETLFGRRRYLPDINAKNATVRALAERNAVNAPIQGTAADIIKLAMIRVDKRLGEAGLKSRMVLQIHDELMFDALPEEVPQLKSIVVEVMENVLKLSVPLTVECSDGKNWLEAH
ncbi:MAG: DNA polymerase I [Bacteroidales bacterium]|nr:DNA polymerase I [Bacteroidales bacterium]